MPNQILGLVFHNVLLVSGKLFPEVTDTPPPLGGILMNLGLFKSYPIDFGVALVGGEALVVNSLYFNTGLSSNCSLVVTGLNVEKASILYSQNFQSLSESTWGFIARSQLSPVRVTVSSFLALFSVFLQLFSFAFPGTSHTFLCLEELTVLLSCPSYALLPLCFAQLQPLTLPALEPT